MGNTEPQTLQTSFPTNVVVPQLEKQTEIKRILRSYTSSTEEKLKKNFKTFILDDMELYGQIDPNTRQLMGYGSLKKAGIVVFEGQFANSLQNGYGVEYLNGQIVFEGNYVNDLRDGWGKTNTYQGQYCRGKRQGWGIEITPNGRYEGYWKDDRYEGMGIKSYSSQTPQNLFESMTIDVIGMAQDNSPCDIYIGEWKDGKRNGIGKFRGIKQSYQGQFANDLYHGEGTLFIDKKARKGIFDRGVFLH